MQFIFLTPASISYLNQSLLALLITIYLGMRLYKQPRRQRTQQDFLLYIFFITVSVFSLLLFLDVSLLPADRLYIVYLQNTVLGVVLILLIQFAYHFPELPQKRKSEKRMVMALLAGYTLWEAGFAVWRFYRLRNGQVEFRPDFTDIFPALGFLWAIFLFARSTLLNWRMVSARRFALVFIVPFWLSILNLIRSFYGISDSAYHVNMSIGILFTIFFFALAYLMAQPEKTSFAIKLSGAVLTAMLALFGTVPWLVAPSYASQYSPNIKDHRTIHFEPNSKGGYDIAEIPFYFVPDLGTNIGLTDDPYKKPFAAVNFRFPFYGTPYDQIFISNDGAIGMGETFNIRNFQYRFTTTPAIVPLLSDLEPEKSISGGVFLQKDETRLVVTYKDVPSFFYAENVFTFQVCLYPDGSFDITYNGLPNRTIYYVNDHPLASIWAMGVKPALLSGQSTDLFNLPVQSGAGGALQDEYRNFRRYLHLFLLPLAIAVLASSLILVASLWFLFKYGFAQPLDSLLNGVQLFNDGKRSIHIPVQFNDEIGFLTQSFNNLTSELDDMLTNLEKRVANQTVDLRAVNEQLRKLTIAIEQSPSSIVITNAQSEIEYVNPSFTKISGYSPGDVIGQNPRILKSGMTPPEVFEQMWANLVNGKPWRGELVNKRKDGGVYWEYTVIAPIYDAEGQITHFVAVKDDVTERHKADAALREGEEQYRQLFELESDAIVIIRNEDGRILQANSASSSLYGFDIDELLSLRNVDLSAEQEQTTIATNTLFPSEQIVRIPLRWHRKKDGTVFPVEITARFITWKGMMVHIAAIRDITNRVLVEQELQRLASTDPLTGLYNRRYFISQSMQYFGHAGDSSSGASLIMMDIDHFKQFNDRHGHEMGDVILKGVAELLVQSVRPTDILARYGGEEFVLFLPQTREIETMQIAERIREKVENFTILHRDKTLKVTISIGVASMDGSVIDLDILIRRADQALYVVKQSGRNRSFAWQRE